MPQNVPFFAATYQKPCLKGLFGSLWNLWKYMYMLCTKSINCLVSIQNFDWPLFYSFLTSKSTLDRHLDWYSIYISINTRLTLRWLKQPVDGKQSDRLIFIDQARCQSSVDPLLMKRSIKSIDWHLTMDASTTHDLPH